MLWRYVEKKVKNNFYPDLYYWSQNLPRTLRRSVYKKHGLNIRFEVIPENFPPMLYYWHFNKLKGYHYPTDDDIKFFYFTLFKKNGFIFLIFCCIVYRNCFLEFLLLCLKSGIFFYLITYFIYMLFFIKKHIVITIRFLKILPKNLIPTVLIININNFLNIIFNSKKKKMVFLNKNSNEKVYQALNKILGLSNFHSKLICKKFGFQQKCIIKDLDSFEMEQLKNYLTSNFKLNKSLIESTNKNVRKKMDLGTYEGKRHNLGYPVRGQRTLSNGKTQRNLYRFRFHYSSDLFNHAYFKNKRQHSKKKKKLKK